MVADELLSQIGGTAVKEHMPLAANPSQLKLLASRARNRFQDEQASNHFGMVIGKIIGDRATPIVAGEPNAIVSQAFDELINIRSQRPLVIPGERAFAVTEAPQVRRYDRKALCYGRNNFPPLEATSAANHAETPAGNLSPRLYNACGNHSLS